MRTPSIYIKVCFFSSSIHTIHTRTAQNVWGKKITNSLSQSKCMTVCSCNEDEMCVNYSRLRRASMKCNSATEALTASVLEHINSGLHTILEVVWKMISFQRLQNNLYHYPVFFLLAALPAFLTVLYFLPAPWRNICHEPFIRVS